MAARYPAGPASFAAPRLGAATVAVSVLALAFLLLPSGAGLFAGPPSSPAPRLLVAAVPGAVASDWHAGAATGQVSSATLVGVVRLLDLGSAAAPIAAGPSTDRSLTTGRPVGPSTSSSPPAAAAVLAPRAASVTVGPGFEGLNYSQCSCAPPDVIDAAGPTQVVEMVNLWVEVYSKEGVPLHGTSAASFFGAGNDFLSDPKVLYDNETGRWFASIFDAGPSGTGLVRLAVSETSNATGSWYIYTLVHAPSGEFPDQPILGVSTRLVAFGGNMFSESTSSFYGSEYWVVDKAPLLNGTTAAVESWGPDPNYLSIHPVQSLGPTATQYFVTTTSASTDNVTMLAVTGVPPSSSVTWTTLFISTYTTAPAGREPSGGSIDSADTRVQSAVWQADHLWLAFDDQCTPIGDSVARACVRVNEISTSSSTVIQDFDYGLDGYDVYYPALSLDARGDLTMVFGYSSASLDPSVGVTGQAASDLAGTWQAYHTVVTGSGTLSCGGPCRYGDYFGAAIDPTSSTVWVAGEYTTASLSWTTWIAPVVTAGPARAALTASAVHLDLGQAVTLSVVGENVTCGSLFRAYCDTVVPLGDGTTATSPCSAATPGLSLSHNFSSTGTFVVGLNGYLGVYSNPGCTPVSQVENLSIVPVDVVVSPSPQLALGASPANGADVGQSLTLSAAASGGLAPFSYRWAGLPAGCSDSATAWVNCTASVPGASTVVVNATDANGVSRTAQLPYTISPALEITVATTRSSVDVGQLLTLNANPAGGTGAYGLEWFGLPTGCYGTNISGLDCVPTAAGNFSVTVEVVDSNGASTLSAAVSLAVAPAITLSLGPIDSSPVGRAVTLSLRLTGGTGPFSVSWSGLPASCLPTDSVRLTCTPGGAGSYSVHVVVTDSVGGSASTTATWTVTAAPTGLTMAELLAIAGVTVVACLAVAFLVLRRRDRRPPRART